MSDENTKKYQDAYNLFASVVGIEPKDYTVFKVDNDGDTLTITPGRPAIMSFEDAVKKVFQDCVQEYNQEMERARAAHRDHVEHPGMERFGTNAQFWDEVQKANLETKIQNAVSKCITEALR